MHFQARRRATWTAALLGLFVFSSRASALSDPLLNPRFDEATALLPNGNILIMGGETAPGAANATNNVQISVNHTIQLTEAAVMSVARASFTATVLPTGEVLAAGGVNGAGVLSSAEIYSPVLNCWRSAGNMTSARFNHTATLLKTGNVLICGGDNGAGALQSCDLYTPPAAPAAVCAGSAGSFAAAGAMAVPREQHTATLLTDGRVYIAGGLDPALNPSYLVTTEVYTPSANTFHPAAPLVVERARHTATLMGNGKVFIAGGHYDLDKVANRGHLESTEIYDPVADAEVPAAPMESRKEAFTATLDQDGSIKVYGGLGNITTNYTAISGPINSGGNLTLTPTGVNQATVSGGSASLDEAYNLTTGVEGVIRSGLTLYSNPKITCTAPGGTEVINFPNGQFSYPSTLSGLYSDMQGTVVSCSNGACGQIARTQSGGSPMPLHLTGSGGTISISSQAISVTPAGLGAVSQATFSGSVSQNTPPAALTGGVLISTTVGLIGGFDPHLAGWKIQNIVLYLTAGTITDPNGLFSISVTSATGTVPNCNGVTTTGCPSLVSDGSGHAQTSAPVPISWALARGTITGSSTTVVNSPATLTNDTLTAGSALVFFITNGITLDQSAGTACTFSDDISTVVVNDMIFGDEETYNPNTNSWSFNGAHGNPMFNQSAILTPQDDQLYFGGQMCDQTGGNYNAACPAALVAAPAGSNFTGYILKLPTWSNLGPAPGVSHHTTTVLPSGKLLIAGGSNGPNVVTNSYLFDPNTQTFAPTGSLNVPRDQHTATLMTNGRVLVAGGFTTNSVSTGATTSAEIYYPDTGVWLQTSPLSQARDNHAAVVMADGNVMVTGGFNNSGGTYLNSVEVYYSTSGVWKTFPSMKVNRALHTMTLLQDGRILVTGGVNETGVQASAEIFDPATGAWDSAGADAMTCLDNSAPGAGPIYCPSSAIRVHSHQATLLQDGQVLVSGGNSGSGETNTSLLFQPASDQWTNTSPALLAAPRFGHTATLLPNGNVLIAGGAQSSGNSVPYVETFSVHATSWQIVGNLNASRAFHTATLAPNGSIYVIGGSNNSLPVATAETVYFAGATPDQDSIGAPPSLRQPTIGSVDTALFTRGQNVTMLGARFMGNSEASGGGSAGGNSSQFHPRIILEGLDSSGGTGSQGDGAFALDLSTQTYILNNPSGNVNLWKNVDSSITVQMPLLGPGVTPPPQGGQVLPYGWYHLRVGSNAQFSTSMIVQAGPAKPPVAPTNVSGVALSTTQIQWTWTWPAGAGMTPDGFDLYYSSSGVFITTIAFVTPGNTQTWLQTGLAPDTTAQITIAAYTLSGDGPNVLSPIVYSNVATPTFLAISSVTPNSVGLSWNTSGNATGTLYEISMSTLNPPQDFGGGDLSVSTPVPTLLGLTTNNYLIANLQPSTTYDFRVRAFDGFGNASGFSNVVTTETLAPIGNVIGVRAGPTSIQFTWINPCVGQTPCSFNVYNGTSGVLIANVSNSLFLETNLSTNTANDVRVQAVTGAGPGPLSPGTTVFTDAVAPASIPAPITGISTGSFTAAWAAGANPLGTRYNVVVTPLGPAAGATSTMTTTGFSLGAGSLGPPAAAYNVQVLAVNGDGFATNVDSPTAVLNYGTVNLLANAPSGLTAPSVTPTSILLNWSTNNNSSSATYQVTYSTDNFVDVQTALSFNAHVSTGGFLVTGLLSSSTYSFVVQAENLAGVKTASSTILTVQTGNGGAPPGELGGTASSSFNSTISGTLGNGQSVSMFVPASAFPSDTLVVISSYSVGATPACPNVPAGNGMGIAITDSPAFQPQKPITVTLSYSPAQLAVPASQAALMRVDPVSGTCVPLQTVVDTTHQTLTAQLNHFSIYELGGLTPASNVDSALIFPNPFYPSRGNGYVTFDQLPAGAWLRIFTLRGELVYEANTNGSGLLTWPGTNRSGRSVASGVYLVSIESGGDKRIYKLAVER